MTCLSTHLSPITALQCFVSGPFGKRVMAALGDQGLSAARLTDLDDDPGLPPIAKMDTLLVLDFAPRDLFAEIQNQLQGTGHWVHMISLLGDMMFVGPHFCTNEPGCPDCFTQRRLAALNNEDLARIERIEHSLFRSGRAPRPAFSPALPKLAVDAFVGSLAQGFDQRRNRFLRFRHDGSFLEDGHVLALHGCRCRDTGCQSNTPRSLGLRQDLGLPETSTLAWAGQSTC